MFKTHTCISLHCDGCLTSLENEDGGISHYEPGNQQRALDEAESDEWHILRDGRVYCTATKCEALLPDCVCVGDDCDAAYCPVGCPCPLHAEVLPVVLPGQMEIGGGS